MMKSVLKIVTAGVAAVALSACVIDLGSTTNVNQPVACGAAKHQSLIGKASSEIDRATLPSSFRIVCFQCPMTMDYREDRLTIQLDKNERVESARCG